MLSILLQACGGKEPTQNDVIGTWKSSDGATFIFNNDGTFIGESLPAEYFTFYTSKSEVEGKKINGTGKWKLEKGKGAFQEVSLDFRKIDNKDLHGLYQILIAGENGVLDNKPPWYLFEWKGEEGGERYKFLKQ